MVLPPQPRWGRWYLHVTVSLLSGSLEVSARLTSVDGFELLVKVLEANKALLQRRTDQRQAFGEGAPTNNQGFVEGDDKDRRVGDRGFDFD